MAFDIYQLDRFAAGEEPAEEALPAYQDALLERFSRSPEGQARSQVDPELGFWAAQLIDYGYTYLGVTLPRMRVTHLREILGEIFPRKISLASPEDANDALPELIAFWEYLQREYQLPAAETLLGYLRNVNPAEFKRWMTDPTKFGMAKSLLMRGQAAGFDVTDHTESQALINLYNAGRLTQGPGAAPSMFGEERDPGKKDAAKAKRLRKLAKASRRKNRKRK
jgi:hypothetical protein